MSKATRLFLVCSILLVFTALPQRTLGQGSGTQISGVTTVPNSTNMKFPRVRGSGTTVHIAGSSGESAVYWSKGDTANSFPIQSVAGTADTGGKTEDYANTSVAVKADGTAYMAWNSQFSGIYLRKRVNNAWNTTRVVSRSGAFRSHVDVAVSQDGTLMVTWNEDGFFRYRVSTDDGVSWSGDVLTNIQPYARATVTGGPGGTFLAAYSSGGPSGSRGGRVYGAIWDGSRWIQSLVGDANLGYNSDASPAITPSGTMYVAWRSSSGIYYSERQANGSWPVSRLSGGEAYGTVGLQSDASGNLHLSWVGNISGDWDIWYLFKPANANWLDPVRVEGGGGVLANASVAGTLNGFAYGHSTAEDFTGTRMATRYARFATAAGASGKPVIEDNAPYTNKTTLSVRMTEIQGVPSQVRYRWDAEPTDANPWQSFSISNPVFSAPAPTGLDGTCQNRRLYAQVQGGPVFSDDITFDTVVQANISAVNPNMQSVRTTKLVDSLDEGASNGAPNYTRSRQVFLNVRDGGDCAKLKSYSVTGGTSGGISGSFSEPVTLPGSASPGPRPVQVQVLDTLDNSASISTTVIYDPANTGSPTAPNTEGLPVVSETTTATVGLENSVIRTLSFSNTFVTDNLYGQAENLPQGKQFWGVWIANSRTDVGADSPALVYQPVQVFKPDTAFDIKWNLFNGLNQGTATNQTGTYYIYVRFLDGAGNYSARSLKLTAQLEPGYQLPKTLLPVLIK
ncbi:MAG: sialidase family protein [Roseiflexaceae bacterium]